MKNKTGYFALLFLMSFLILLADEVLVDGVDKKLSVINLGSFTSKNNAKNIIQKFAKSNDTYTGFYENKYYVYLVNIRPEELNTSLQNAKNIISDAYISSKKSFDYGVVLYEKEDENLSISVDKNQTVNVIGDSNITVPASALLLMNENDTKSEALEKPSMGEGSLLEESLIIKKSDNNLHNLKADSESQDIVYVDLLDVVLQTLSQSYKLKASKEKMIQAQHNIDVSYAEYKPTIDFEYTIGSTKRTPGDKQQNGIFEDRKVFGDERASVAVNQNLYSAGKSEAQVSKAEIDYAIAKNDYYQVVESEILKAINAYFDVVFRRESLKTNEENIEKLQTIFEITKIKFDNGALSVGELSSVEASIANAMAQLSRTKSLFNNAIEFYNFITNEMFDNTYPYQKEFDIVFPELTELEQKVLQYNSKLRGFQLLIASKKETLNLEKSSFGPKVDLQLNASRIMDKEDYQIDEDEYSARLKFSYNIYNGGRDRANYLKAFSSIQQTIHEQEAQIREILWNLKKLHTTLSSLDENIKNNEDEVDSSRNMVDSYWEGFRYGEQDLNILLQAQRQLNAAQLDMINNKLEKLISYYKVLEMSGGLIKHFGLDIESDNFLDMAQGRYHQKASKRIYKEEKIGVEDLSSMEQNQSIEPMERMDDNITKNFEENLSEAKEVSSFADFVEYGEIFLMQNPENYTIVFEDFEDIYEALKFIKDNNILNRSYIFKTLNKENVQTNIAHEVYLSFQDAQKALSQMPYSEKESRYISKIEDVVNSAMQFNQLALVEKKELQPIAVEKKITPVVYETNPEFKRKFLNANKEYYTINVTTFQSVEDAFKVAQSQGMLEESFIFEYGEQLKLAKLMYGVFETYKDAQKSLDSLGLIKTHYLPVVERIGKKQALYYRYHQK